METVKRVWIDFRAIWLLENLLKVDVNFILKLFIGFLGILTFFTLTLKLEILSPLEDFKVYKNVSKVSNKISLSFKTPESYTFKAGASSFGLIELGMSENFQEEDFEKVFLSSFPKRMHKRVRPYTKAILKISEYHQIDPFWVASIIWTESHFNWKAQSHVGAKGLMQIMPKTKKWLYWQIRKNGNFLMIEKDDFKVQDFYNFKITKNNHRLFKYRLVNIEMGIIYLNRLLKRFDGNHKLATVAYNMGPGWTLKRLRNKQPVGVKNQYLDKVKLAYQKLSSSLWQLPL